MATHFCTYILRNLYVYIFYMKRILFILSLCAISLAAQSQVNWTPIGWAGSARIVNGEREVRFNMGSAGNYSLTDTLRKYRALPGAYILANPSSPQNGYIDILQNVTARGFYSKYQTDNVYLLQEDSEATIRTTSRNGTVFRGAVGNIIVRFNDSNSGADEPGIWVRQEIYSKNGISLLNTNDNNGVRLSQDGVTTNRSQKLQDKDGIVALKVDVDDAIAAYSAPSQIDNDLNTSTTRGASKAAILGGLATKENLITPAANTTVFRGDKTFVTLNTDIVPEGSTNLYGTNARVLSYVLTGYTAGSNTAITAASTVLNAFRNLQAQITAQTTAVRLAGTQSISANLTVTLAMFGANGMLTIKANAGTGNITVTVPASIPAGYTINLKKSDATANTVTISGNSSTYNGASSDVLSTQHQAKTYISTATSTFDIF